MLNICRQLFGVHSLVRHFRSGLVPRPIGLTKDIERWQTIHTDHLIKLLKERKISEATTYFYKEVKYPTLSMYSLLLSSIGKAGHSRLAFHLFRDMRARDMRPTAATLTSLFNSCANNNEDRDAALGRAKNLYEQMLVHGWTAAPATYHSIMKAFAVLGGGDTCFRLLDEMEKRSLPITVDTYNHLLMGCIADKNIGYILAIRVLRFMLWKRIRPNVKTFDFLLKAVNDCGCGDDVELLNKLLNDVRQTQLRDPQIALISSGQNLLDVRLNDQLVAVSYAPKTPAERLQLIGGLKGILTQMTYFQVEPTPVTYTYLIKTFENEDNLMEFVKSLDQTKLDMGFWNQLLKKCIIENYSCVQEVISIINDRKMKKDSITFGILAMAAQTPEQIKGLIDEMEQKKFTLNEVIMSTLVNNASRRYQTDVLSYLLEYCERYDICLNQKALRSLAILFDRSSRSSVPYIINKFLKRVKTTSANEQSRLKQFEPDIWKRDRNRFDPDASEAAQVAREKGHDIEDDDELDATPDLEKFIQKEDAFANLNKELTGLNGKIVS